jgi:hypothetical protein
VLSTMLDLLGAVCLGVCAFLVWAPLVFGVVGVALIASARRFD